MEKIDEDCPFTLLPLAAFVTASAPKHLIAWCLRLAVDDLSFESWKRRTPPKAVLHQGAAQVKK